MLPTSILALTATFIAPILAAPSCTSTSNGYAPQKMVYLFNDFCAKLNETNFGSKQKYYDMPVVALGFTAGSVGACSLKDCLTNFGTLVNTCQKDVNSIFGTGNVASGCGTYSFQIQDTSATTSLGAPDATITAATIKTYNVATLTSTSSSSSTSTSSSSYTASTTSEAQLESTYAPSTHVYLNATTSSEVPSNSSTEYSSATLTASSSSRLVAATTTATKPEVGTATLGTSGAGALRVSGLSLVIVAGVFGVFL